MKITIITANYNSGKTLKKTIESVLNQTYELVEYIIIDGKSTDNSLEIIESYLDKFKDKGYEYKWISEKDKGIFNAMNKGIEMAKGDIIGIIGADDWYETETLKLVAREFKKDSNIDMVYGLLRRVKLGKFYDVIGNYNSYGKGQHPTVFIKKEIFNKVGKFDEKYNIAADSDFLLKIKKIKLKYIFIDKILVNFSMEGVSNKKYLATRLEDLEVCYKNGEYGKKELLIRYIYIYIRYIIEKFLKKR